MSLAFTFSLASGSPMPLYSSTSIVPQWDSSLYCSFVANSSMSSMALTSVWSTSR